MSSQFVVAIHYQKQTLLTKDLVKGLPDSLKDEMIKQVNEIKSESVLYIQGNENLYHVKSKDVIKNNDNLKNNKNDKTGATIISSSFEHSSKEKKLIKNFKNNNYTIKENGKLVAHKLPKAIWKYTSKTKKVAGYNCFEATTTFNNHKLTVFFTRELWTKGSPDKLPFLDGVILEYNYSHFYVKAVNVDLQVPLITNFL
ncbi:hypothetical protein FBFR_09985 [Flavobacterium fryxellicola]|uniref:GLPGLI family protein n=2 Tax=Flavobacterium fryxellicola TaxID=249352 RepID=A0A167XAD4_9FLAO|nr:hypothetical protein FBFR_09985 [Flavobacterium fryxellicola]